MGEMIDPETMRPGAGEINNDQKQALLDAASNKILLEPCPCGLTPDRLYVEVMQPGKYARASGDCCGNWSIEFKLNYEQDAHLAATKAGEAWNTTPRRP